LLPFWGEPDASAQRQLDELRKLIDQVDDNTYLGDDAGRFVAEVESIEL
jgi:hypothetical protein